METELSVFQYSPKSICITGNSADFYKDGLKELGGRKNRGLTDTETLEKFAGYIIPLSKRNELEDLLGINMVEVEDFETKKERKVDQGDIQFYMYSERSFIVTGNTESMREDLMEMNGSWNKYLKGCCLICCILGQCRQN